jgi:opacity protein-like surface antigen
MNQCRFILFGAFIALLLDAVPAAAQLTLQAGGGVGLAMPMGDYGGSTMEYYKGTKYGLANGVNVHARARVGALGIRVVGEVAYSRFSNSGNSEPGQGKIDVTQQMLTMMIGPEYSFSVPLSPVSAYLGAHAGVHIIGGSTTFQGVSKVPSVTADIQSGTRIGLGGTVGVIVNVGTGLNLDIAARYDAVNLLGKLWDDPNPLDDQRLDSYLSLNDDPDPLYRPNDDKHFINSSRNISTFHITATLMFGL